MEKTEQQKDKQRGLEQALQQGLSEDEYRFIVDALKRPPNHCELGIFSVMWSEHCSYKSSKEHLKKLPTTAPWVIHGPGENAGAIDIGEGWAAIFKMESHNHPSFIEPYQGAATGVGGILRDVFTMGARPIANLNALRFGEPDAPKMKHLISGVVAGIGGYGNCVGVPTIGGEVNFHSSYNGNILVNAMTVGIARTDKIFTSAAAGVGNPVVYVGSKTGRDGIHGATMASAEFDEESESKRPTVQVGDPFTEKRLIEACLELMATDAIIAIQDMGAAGLTSSSVEMASKGGVGISLNMDAVPCREVGMIPYEMMLSESQERMLMVLNPDSRASAEAIFQKWGLDFAIIGKLTDSNRLTLTWKGEVVTDIPLDILSDGAPEVHRSWTATAKPAPLPISDVREPDDYNKSLILLMGCPDIASRAWIWRQYDSTVMANTVQIPGGNAGIVRIDKSNRGLAMSTDCTPRYCYADPAEGGKQAIAECWRNLSAVGAMPLAATDCLNFGNPERPEIMGQFVGCIEGMAESCEKLDFPIVSGNVSLYNETEGEAILPTPGIGGIGLIANLNHIARTHYGDGWDLVLLGDNQGHLGQSLYLREILGREEGPPPPVNLKQEKHLGDFVRKQITTGQADCVHDIADGGLAVALTEMALASNMGFQLNALPGKLPPHAFLFGEDQGRYILAVPEGASLMQAASNEGIDAVVLGKTGGARLIIPDLIDLAVDDVRVAYEGFFSGLFEVES